MDHNEAILVEGAERFSKYKGYSRTFQYDGDYRENEEIQENGILTSRYIVMDALYFSYYQLQQFSEGDDLHNQWSVQSIVRELNKAFVGFSFVQVENEDKSKQIKEKENKVRDDSDQVRNGVLATGHWGCGAFNGDKFLKFVIQWIAASEAGVTEMRYSCMNDKEFISQVSSILQIIQPEYSTINNDEDQDEKRKESIAGEKKKDTNKDKQKGQQKHESGSQTAFFNDVPQSLDARERWGDAILPVRNDMGCKIGWAFAIAESIGDRLGIINCSQGNISVGQLYQCGRTSYGCNQEDVIEIWKRLLVDGITTEECIPYISPDLSPCPQKCVDGQDITKITLKGAYKVKPREISIQEIINIFGPTVMQFELYEDFMNYKSGIYRHKYGQFLGIHTVLAIGWGNIEGLPYWLCQNSWGPEWGEQGFFKILRSVNECKCEDNVSFSLPNC
ncbi:MAG: putative cathepsin B4 cysteine protease [Streblomastix strix]|uniref:Putative cathepsin B4 cysteine protease n=1 Tax=Streblomastix strix TaxID=222440 RepID=A0A5J4X3V6_9EUKA|nr:MAG: putative cathepsin B4 cysteine protease [Streblomastix strix]